MNSTPETAEFDAVRSLVTALPYVQAMGIGLSLSDGVLTGRLPYVPSIVGNPKVPALHGGAIASLLQMTGAAQLMLATRAGRIPRMFSITVEYLNSAQLIDTWATATIVNRSRRFANLRVQACQTDEATGTARPISCATVQFVLV